MPKQAPCWLAGTYKASLLRAYERTVREARFALVIVDAPNLYAEDLKPYWTAGQVLCSLLLPCI